MKNFSEFFIHEACQAGRWVLPGPIAPGKPRACLGLFGNSLIIGIRRGYLARGFPVVRVLVVGEPRNVDVFFALGLVPGDESVLVKEGE